MSIHFLSTRRHDYTMRRHLDGPAAAMASRVRLVAYEDVLDDDPATLPDGTWIFTDFDRLPPDRAAAAAALWRRVAARGCRLLNHPTRSLRRHGLMRALRAWGINDFDSHPVDDLRTPLRWPVFVRRADAHSGPASALLHDPAKLGAVLDRMRALGWPLHAFVVVEFRDTRDADGLYRKYGALRIGEAIVPFHVIAAPNWCVKFGPQGVWSAAHVAWEADLLARNPHADALRAIFDRAGLQYGRIDYGLHEGRIQVWEINSNPSFSGPATRMAERAVANRLVNDRIVAALAALAPEAV